MPVLEILTMIGSVLCAGYTAPPIEGAAKNKTPSLIGEQNIAAIRKMALESNYSYDQARFLSNNIGPRLSGSPQAAAAVSYVAQQMRDLGLDVRLEPVTVCHWVRGREEAELVRYPGQVHGTGQKILVTALGNSGATPEQGTTAPIVIVNDFEQLERLPADQIKGKIILFNHTFDDFTARAGLWEQAYGSAVQFRSDGPARAAKKGAVAVLVRSPGSGMFRLAHTGMTRYEEGTQQIPAGAVPAEDAELISELARQGPVEIHLVLTPRDLPREQSHNVVADLKGSERPEQVVIVSAHLDSWDLGTGALDDAAGVGIAMDVLRMVKKLCPHPKRTLRFVAWIDEENATAGGLTYAADHAAELRDHIAAIEIDYGDGRPLALNVAGQDERVEPILAVMNVIAGPIGGVLRVNDSPATDLRAINEKGVPAIAPLQDARHYFDYHHTLADTFDKIRIDELRRVVALIAPLAYGLAQNN